jgi:hypothetical protein
MTRDQLAMGRTEHVAARYGEILYQDEGTHGAGKSMFTLPSVDGVPTVLKPALNILEK